MLSVNRTQVKVIDIADVLWMLQPVKIGYRRHLVIQQFLYLVALENVISEQCAKHLRF